MRTGAQDKERRRFYAIKNALTDKEKELIAFYELQWKLRCNVPTIEEVAKFTKQSQTTVNYYLQRKPVIAALDKRGVPWRQHSQNELTATQVAAASVMMNFTDIRSNSEKLDELGILPETYYAWLDDPQFKNLIDVLSDRNLKNIKPTAITEFTKLINKGDWNAIRYYLDVTGAMRNDEAPQSEHLMMMLIEIIQKHVKDQSIMIAIAEDMQRAFHNRTLEVVYEQPAITNEVVDSEELADARKKLGI